MQVCRRQVYDKQSFRLPVENKSLYLCDNSGVMSMKQAAIYLRVSTDQQNYDRQKKELEDYCKRNQLEIKYLFEEKESGRKDDRPEFKKLCELTKDDIQVVVVWEISRLSRKAYMILKVAEDFAQKGISIFAFKENLTTLDNNGNFDKFARLVLSVLANYAQDELETFRERSLSGKKHKLLSGEMDYTFKPPYGYRKNNKKLVINEDEAEQIKKLFELFVYGHKSTRQLAISYGWTQNRVSYALKNPAYMGEVKYKYDPSIPLYVPAIISKELYYAAQDILKQRRGNQLTADQRYDNKLRGKIFCGLCSSKMYYSKDKRVSIYTCKTNTHKERYQYCSTRIAKHKVDEVLNILLRRRLAEDHSNDDRDNLVRELTAKNKNVEKIAEQQESLKNKLDLLEKKIRALVDAGLDVKDELQNRRRLSKDRDNLEESRSKELKDIETLTRSLNDYDNMNYKKLMKDNELRDRVVGDMVENITVYYLTAGHYLHIRLIGDLFLYGCYIKKQKLYPGEDTQIEYITVDGIEIDGKLHWLNKEIRYDTQDKVFRYVGGNQKVNMKKRDLVNNVFEKIQGIGVESFVIDTARSLAKAMLEGHIDEAEKLYNSI